MMAPSFQIQKLMTSATLARALYRRRLAVLPHKETLQIEAAKLRQHQFIIN
jgi:hypothetical protein